VQTQYTPWISDVKTANHRIIYQNHLCLNNTIILSLFYGNTQSYFFYGNTQSVAKTQCIQKGLQPRVNAIVFFRNVSQNVFVLDIWTYFSFEDFVVVIVWWLDLQLQVQSVHSTTKIVCSNPDHDEVYSIHHFVIKCGRSVVFSCVFHQQNWLPRYNWNIVKSCVKHHNLNPF
jgi:hypothetical protein